MNMKSSAMIMAVVAGWMTAINLAAADPIFVDLNAAGDNNGSSWTDAYTNLQTAIEEAVSDDVLWVAEGVYTNDIDGTESFSIDKSLTIYGGFTNGMETLGDRDATAHPTILDGEKTRRVLNITAGNVLLDGLTVKKGVPSNEGGGDSLDQRRFVDNRGLYPYGERSGS